jgi:hypothetical protein
VTVARKVARDLLAALVLVAFAGAVILPAALLAPAFEKVA